MHPMHHQTVRTTPGADPGRAGVAPHGVGVGAGAGRDAADGGGRGGNGRAAGVQVGFGGLWLCRRLFFEVGVRLGI